MTDPAPPSAAMEVRANHWDDLAQSVEDPRAWVWRRHADSVNDALCRRWIRGRVRRLLKTDAYDEAVGPGLARTLGQLAEQVAMVDVAASMAARARRQHDTLRVSAADVRALPFADQSFDIVVSNSTLDHFTHASSIGDALRELHRVLTVGGRLLVTLDNPDNPLVWMRNGLPFAWLHRIGLVPYFVGATLGRRALMDVLEASGFSVLDVTAVLHCPRVLAVPLAAVAGEQPSSSVMPTSILRALAACERAERWPTRFRTGHFVAALAERRA